MDDFSQPKIIYSEIVREPQFYLDNDGRFFPEATVFIMTGENLHYLVDVLNSPVTAYVFKKIYAGGGLGEEGFRYKKQFLLNLPIPKPTLDASVEANIAHLYQLSEEEIDFIESQYNQ